MNKISTTQKILIFASILFIGAVISYVFLYKQINVLHKKISSIESNLVVAKKDIKNKKETTNLLDKTKKERKELLSYFVSIEDPTPFLELIESTGKKANVYVEVQSLDVKDKEETQHFIKTVLLVKGDWNSVFKFISLLEVFPYAVTVSHSAFSVGEIGKWEGQITLLCAEI